MNEIPKNPQGSSIPQQPQTQKIDQVKPEAVQDTTQAPSAVVQTKEIKEIPENPADRSAIKVDNLDNDTTAFV